MDLRSDWPDARQAAGTSPHFGAAGHHSSPNLIGDLNVDGREPRCPYLTALRCTDACHSARAARLERRARTRAPKVASWRRTSFAGDES